MHSMSYTYKNSLDTQTWFGDGSGIGLEFTFYSKIFLFL